MLAALYANVCMSPPVDCERLCVFEIPIRFSKDSLQWKMHPNVAAKIGGVKGPVKVYMIACKAWRSSGDVAITIKGSPQDHEDHMNDLTKVVAYLGDGDWHACTDFFNKGYDLHAALVYLYRVNSESKLKARFPDIKLADFKHIKPEGTGASSIYRIPIQSAFGKIILATHEAMETTDATLEPVVDGLDYMIKATLRNPCIGGASGNALLQQVRADLASTIKPIDISNLSITAESKHADSNWTLWMRLVIVYEIAE